MTISLSSHIVDLARELIDDVELSRLPAEQLLLKAARLARLIEDQDAAKWLRYELNGYTGDAVSREYMLRFGRLESANATHGYFQPLAGVSGAFASMQPQAREQK